MRVFLCLNRGELSRTLLLYSLSCAFYFSINQGYSQTSVRSPVSLPSLNTSIKKGIDFLSNAQTEWGEFATYMWNKKNKEFPEYVSSVFITTFVVHSLNFVEQSSIIKDMKFKAIQFLQKNMEGVGTWRFFCKGSKIAPDLDDTCCILAILKQNNVNVDIKLLDFFLKFRKHKDKLFYTWIGIPNRENDVSPIVNANVLWFYSLMNRTKKIPEVIDYLNKKSNLLRKKPFKSMWYCSSSAFCYMVTRVYAEGNIVKLRNSNKSIQQFLCSTQKSDGSWGNELETALSTVSLLNIGYFGSKVDKAVQFLLSKQDSVEGSWPIAPFCKGPEKGVKYFFGSEELTTAICLEALAKYKLMRENNG